MATIVAVTMLNFLGYKNLTKSIDDLQRFSALCGGIGAGKSTILMAVMFVLGLGPEEEEGEVTVTIATEDGSTRFTRKRTNGNTYHIDDTRVAKTMYFEELRKLNINPSFGDIMILTDQKWIWHEIVDDRVEVGKIIKRVSDSFCTDSIETEKLLVRKIKKAELKKSKKVSDQIELQNFRKELRETQSQINDRFQKTCRRITRLMTKVVKHIYGHDNVNVTLDVVTNLLRSQDVVINLMSQGVAHPIDRCSQGEKKLVSLALFLTLNLMIKSPFMLIDDLDRHIMKRPSLTETLSDISEAVQIIVTTKEPSFCDGAQGFDIDF